MSRSHLTVQERLNAALELGEKASVQKALDEGASPNEPARGTGWSPIHIACASQNTTVEIIELLVKVGANLTLENRMNRSQPIHCAFQSGKADVLKYVIDKVGATVVARAKNRRGSTALHCAVGTTGEMVSMVLNAIKDSKGAVNAKELDGDTPLMIATAGESLEQIMGAVIPSQVLPPREDPDVTILNLLLDAGADPSLANVDGNTPLHYVNGRIGARGSAQDASADSEEDPATTSAGILASKLLGLEANIAWSAVKPEFAAIRDSWVYDIQEAMNSGEDLQLSVDVAFSTLMEYTIPSVFKSFDKATDPKVTYETLNAELDLATSASDTAKVMIKYIEALDESAFFGTFKADRKPFLDILQSIAGVKQDSSDVPSSNGEALAAVYLRMIQDAKSDLNARNKYGEFPLNLAARRANIKVMLAMLEHGGNPNATTTQGDTPLISAATLGHLKVVEELLKAGAEVSHRNGDGEMAMHWAAYQGHKAVLERLLAAPGADPNAPGHNNRTLLAEAVNGVENRSDPGDLAVVSYIIDNLSPDVNKADKDGQTCLHFAAKQSNVTLIRVLLDKAGAAVDVRDKDGATPLYYAVSTGNVATTKTLVEAGADPNIMGDGFSAPPLLNAVRAHPNKTGVELLSVMLKAKVTPDLTIAETKSSRTVLHFAAQVSSSTEALEMLIATGDVDMNPLDAQGTTPLSFMINNGSAGISSGVTEKKVKLMLDAGSDPDLQDADGDNALNEVIGHLLGEATGVEGVTSIKNIIELLLKKNPTLAQTGSDGTSLLEKFVHQCNAPSLRAEGCVPIIVDMAKLLVNNGAPLVPHQGNTFLPHIVVQQDNDRLIPLLKYLMKAGAPVTNDANRSETALHAAARQNSVKLLNALFEADPKLDVNNNANSRKWTPLVCACVRGALDAVKYLIVQHKADTQILTEDNETAIQWAVFNGHIDVVKYMIKLEKDVNHKGWRGRGLLHEAIQKSHVELLVWLVNEAGCTPDLQQDDGQTPLHYACSKLNWPMVEALLTRAKANPNILDQAGRSPLQYAVRGISGPGPTKEQVNIVRALCVARADVNQSPVGTGNAFTPLERASSAGWWEITEIMLTIGRGSMPTRGTAPEAYRTVPNKTNPIHVFAKQGYQSLMEGVVADTDVNINVKDEDGKTPLDYAAAGGYSAIVEILSAQDDSQTGTATWTPVAVLGALLFVVSIVQLQAFPFVLQNPWSADYDAIRITFSFTLFEIDTFGLPNLGYSEFFWAYIFGAATFCLPLTYLFLFAPVDEVAIFQKHASTTFTSLRGGDIGWTLFRFVVVLFVFGVAFIGSLWAGVFTILALTVIWFLPALWELIGVALWSSPDAQVNATLRTWRSQRTAKQWNRFKFRFALMMGSMVVGLPASTVFLIPVVRALTSIYDCSEVFDDDGNSRGRFLDRTLLGDSDFNELAPEEDWVPCDTPLHQVQMVFAAITLPVYLFWALRLAPLDGFVWLLSPKVQEGEEKSNGDPKPLGRRSIADWSQDFPPIKKSDLDNPFLKKSSSRRIAEKLFLVFKVVIATLSVLFTSYVRTLAVANTILAALFFLTAVVWPLYFRPNVNALNVALYAGVLWTNIAALITSLTADEDSEGNLIVTDDPLVDFSLFGIVYLGIIAGVAFLYASIDAVRRRRNNLDSVEAPPAPTAAPEEGGVPKVDKKKLLAEKKKARNSGASKGKRRKSVGSKGSKRRKSNSKKNKAKDE